MAQDAVQDENVGEKLSGTFNVSVGADLEMTLATTVIRTTLMTTAKSDATLRPN